MTSTNTDTHTDNSVRNSFESFYGKRFSVSGKNFDDIRNEGNDGESIAPISDEEIKQFEAGGNGDDDHKGEGVIGESDDNNDKNNNNKKDSGYQMKLARLLPE